VLDKIRKSHVMSYDFCPIQFKIKYIDGVKTPETQNMLIGTRVHKLYDDYIISGLSPEEALSLLPDKYIDIEGEMFEWFIKQEEERKSVEYCGIFGTELQLDAPVLGFTGTIDRIDWIDENHNEVRLVEYKTGLMKDVTVRQELWFYKMLFEECYPDNTVTEFRVYYPRHKEIKTWNVKDTKHARSALLKQIDKLRDSIENNTYQYKCSSQKFIRCGLCNMFLDDEYE